MEAPSRLTLPLLGPSSYPIKHLEHISLKEVYTFFKSMLVAIHVSATDF